MKNKYQAFEIELGDDYYDILSVWFGNDIEKMKDQAIEGNITFANSFYTWEEKNGSVIGFNENKDTMIVISENDGSANEALQEMLKVGGTGTFK